MSLPAPLLTIAQLAVHCSVSVRHLERCDAAGMPSVPVGVRAKRYDAAACLAWMAAHAGDIKTCRSNARPRAGGTSLSASAVNAYTDAYRRAHLRVMPSEPSPN